MDNDQLVQIREQTLLYQVQEAHKLLASLAQERNQLLAECEQLRARIQLLEAQQHPADWGETQGEVCDG